MSKVSAFYLKGLDKKDTKKHKKYILDRRKSAKKGEFISRNLELKSYKYKKSQNVLAFERKYPTLLWQVKATFFHGVSAGHCQLESKATAQQHRYSLFQYHLNQQAEFSPPDCHRLCQ